MKAQHKKWLADVTKFVALSAENTTEEFDIEEMNAEIEGYNLKKAERAIIERLRALVVDLDRIFSPILGPRSLYQKFMDEYLERLEPAVSASQQKAGANYTAVLLIDPTMQILPIEALPSFEMFDGRVTRDFSINMFGHRLKSLKVENQSPRVLAAGMHYIIDPLSEDQGNALKGFERAPTKTLVKRMMGTEVLGGSSWKAIRSENGLVSLQDWISVMDASSSQQTSPKGLFVYTLGRFGSILSPKEISAMNLEGIALLATVDLAYNDTSYRRQNSIDVLKKVKDLENETPLVMAMILTLSGVGCYVQHAWSTPFVSQNRFMKEFWSGLSSKKPLSHAISAAGQLKDKRSVKRWIRYSRLVYGLPNVQYQAD